MTVDEMAKQAGFEVLAGSQGLEAEVTGGYCGDLISAVMTNGEEGNVWVTWHVHQNIVAAAVVTKLAAIILAAGRKPEAETIQKARQEGMPILGSSLPAFEIVGRLHGMGISGGR